MAERVCERERARETWSARGERERVCVRESARGREREGEGSGRDGRQGGRGPPFARIGLSSGGDPAVCSHRIEQLTAF